MKAIVYTKYGSPEVLQLKEIDQPCAAEGEVLLKVHAASVNSWDWDLLTGRPYPYRLLFGIRKPKYPVLGSDVAGIVEAVGKNVTDFQPGDEVFGDISGSGFGSFAEYVAAPAEVLAKKPADITFEEAAAIPQAAVLAWQGLHFKSEIDPGDNVLINGAGGGVGTFAIQMAKLAGAEVTGVDSAEKLDLMKSLGADHVIDYQKEDYTENGQKYDLILDVIAQRTIFAYKRALTANGCFVVVGGSISTILQTALIGSLISSTGNQTMGLLMHQPNRNDLKQIAELVETGEITPVIDQSFPLKEVPEAIRYLGEGHVLGKVVISV